jgi:hypothetical protein
MLSMLIMEKINLDDDFSDEHLRGWMIKKEEGWI